MTRPGIPLAQRSEPVNTKLKLLQQAYLQQRYDLAASLADSIKDSIQLDRQMADPEDSAHAPANEFVATSELPAPWKQWAEGWKYCKPIALHETVNISRIREPVELIVGFDCSQLADPHREVRIARVDSNDGSLREIPSQVWDNRRTGAVRQCRIALLADVGAHATATYLIFYGNPLAELPNYSSDLHVAGERWQLSIENEHYVAQLSHQMGQLERLTSKREHGLELFAGGKGHGEPPTIDWAHDYVEQGGFQKLRIKNWEACPNYEVIRGPICTKLRRWGFPHSPVHPVISPSRMHIDVTYSFWSGVPYFFKESTMEAVVDFEIEAMRDDEWVFSGYSFTKQHWIDRRGKFHEGAVPPEHRNQLWGVGFSNEVSRDAFIALWLEHEVTGGGDINHSGPPTLDYAGHGQLWSRYPAEQKRLKDRTAYRQRNAYHFAPLDFDGRDTIERQRHRLLHPLEVRVAPIDPTGTSTAQIRLARPGETADDAGPKPEIWKALDNVRDDQLYQVEASIVDLGYVYDVHFRGGAAEITVTMPHRGRPIHDFLVTQGGGRVNEGIREHVERVAGVNSVVVRGTCNPPWSIARMNEFALAEVGLF